LFPIALCILALENAALAVSGRIYDNMEVNVNVNTEENGDGGGDVVETENFDNNIFIKAVFVLQAFEVPILLIVIFEITYLVHKRRSVNFCGMYFDEGVRIKSTAFMSCMLRNSIRTLATFLLVMGLIVNFDFIKSGTSVDELAGRAGWWALSSEDWSNRLHLLLSLIPTAVLTLVAFYLSIMLWRYGTESSMVVHSSICNPWFYPFFGTLAMGVGQFFDEQLYTIMSNAGMLIFIITILLLMGEVDKDMVVADDVAWFLVTVAKKGDQIRVINDPNVCSSQSMRSIASHSMRSLSMRSSSQKRNSSSRDEEKIPEDEEMGMSQPSPAGAVFLVPEGMEGNGDVPAMPLDQEVAAEAVSSVSIEDDTVIGQISEEAPSSSVCEENATPIPPDAEAPSLSIEDGTMTDNISQEALSKSNIASTVNEDDETETVPAQLSNPDEENNGPAVLVDVDMKETAKESGISLDESVGVPFVSVVSEEDSIEQGRKFG